MTKNVIVVYNPQSGKDDDTLDLKKAFERSNLSAKFISIHNLSLVKSLIAKEKTYAVVAAGGDGTVNAVADILPRGVALGIIPSGTLNHFAQDLGIPSSLEEAINVISNGRPKQVDVGVVNEKMFLNNSSIGLYPAIVRKREKLQKWIGKRLGGALAAAATVYRLPSFKVDLEIDGQPFSCRTPFIFIGNNSYKINERGFTNRTSLDAGLLCVYLIRSNSRWRILQLLIKTYLGTVRQERYFEEYFVKTLTISSRAKTHRVALDGEVTELANPLKYSTRPKSLRVVVALGG